MDAAMFSPLSDFEINLAPSLAYTLMVTGNRSLHRAFGATSAIAQF